MMIPPTINITQISEPQTSVDKNAFPAVQRYVDKLEAGETAPPIRVDGNVIVDGNHRYVAGRLAGKEPAQVPGTTASSQAAKAKPIQEIKVDKKDWGNK